jgi:hypothetical protein
VVDPGRLVPERLPGVVDNTIVDVAHGGDDVGVGRSLAERPGDGLRGPWGQRVATAATSTVTSMKILQIAPALHGAKMQTSRGTFPVVVWALVENDDGSDDVIGLAVGGKGDRTLLRPDPDTFESYSQTG